jgi:hypothetical protein
MTKSTATTSRRRPVRAKSAAATGGARLTDFEERELATRGATALSPAPGTGTGTTKPRKPRLRVAPPAPVTVPRAPFVVLVLVVVVAGVLGILVLNTKINENAFKLAQLQSQRSNLDQQEQQLDQQLADLESPNSLAAAACRLGMVKAPNPAYLQLPNGQMIGVPQPATGPQCVTSQHATGTGGR